MLRWIQNYKNAHLKVIDSLPVQAVENLIATFQKAHKEDRQIFIFGNGGSAATASHFVTDLGKGASDALSKRFRCLSLNEAVGWMTAIGNDYAYEDIFVRQLENFANPGDLVFTMSVSGNSPNLVKAVEWANKKELHTIALVGGKRGRLAEIAGQVIVIDSTHYGHVEDAHLFIAHLLSYAFMENSTIIGKSQSD
ncbi:MAG: SIS domain-containing protein [Actinobacteria bacterium]|nr:SIS domain-containing protein [Actinomycetota bacterium]